MKGQEPIIHPQTTNNNIPFQYHLKPVDQVLYCESNPQVAAMASEIRQCSRKKEGNRGAWSSEEDKRLVEAVEIHGPRRWKAIAYKAGLKRCGKSCRLRWMNYLRPNIKRGNISDQEEDLILRLHKLLGNRWSLIAGRLPGRTDNEIKNYWNSHLSKKKKQETQNKGFTTQICKHSKTKANEKDDIVRGKVEGSISSRGYDEFNITDNHYQFHCSFDKGPSNLEWTSKFPELDDKWFQYSK